MFICYLFFILFNILCEYSSSKNITGRQFGVELHSRYSAPPQ